VVRKYVECTAPLNRRLFSVLGRRIRGGSAGILVSIYPSAFVRIIMFESSVARYEMSLRLCDSWVVEADDVETQ
jgi:hypothetical protein